jgi:biopolymer transport protein ExbB
MLNSYDAFLGLMDRGGPVMWVILAVACLVFALLVERHVQLFRHAQHASRDLKQLLDNTITPATLMNAITRSPIRLMLHRVNWKKITTYDDLIQAFNQHLAELVPRLEGGLATIAVFASLLPMLGLLGTVLGMIEVFDAIALHGAGRPDAMASGIAQALLTTAAGLTIAIPVIFWHHVLARRLRELLAITEQTLSLIHAGDIHTLKEKGGAR